MFQLVLQFAPWGSRSLDDLIALEDQLCAIDALAPMIDGHDIGSNEANIFILTPQPEDALKQSLPLIDAAGLSNLFGAGVRRIEDDDYVRCWPPGDARAFLVR